MLKLDQEELDTDPSGSVNLMPDLEPSLTQSARQKQGRPSHDRNLGNDH